MIQLFFLFLILSLVVGALMLAIPDKSDEKNLNK